MFACARHWKTLNKEQQRTLYRAYDEYLASRLSLEELRAVQGEVLQGLPK
jgi:hypothetical protein